MSTVESLNIDTSVTDASRPPLAGIHHLKIAVSDLAESLEWYGAALGAERLPGFDHLLPTGELFAYIVKIPGLNTLIELRRAPVFAGRTSGFDPIIFATETVADLRLWADHLDSRGLAHSGVLRGMLGWLLVCRDPNGLSVRFYTNESHELDADTSDISSPWVAYPE